MHRVTFDGVYVSGPVKLERRARRDVRASFRTGLSHKYPLRALNSRGVLNDA